MNVYVPVCHRLINYWTPNQHPNPNLYFSYHHVSKMINVDVQFMFSIRMICLRTIIDYQEFHITTKIQNSFIDLLFVESI